MILINFSEHIEPQITPNGRLSDTEYSWFQDVDIMSYSFESRKFKWTRFVPESYENFRRSSEDSGALILLSPKYLAVV